MGFGVEHPVSSKDYSSLTVLFIEDFSEYALIEGMILLLMVEVVSWVILILTKGKTMRLGQDDNPIFVCLGGLWLFLCCKGRLAAWEIARVRASFGTVSVL